MARPVGSKNTKANELKNTIIASLDRLGGIEYLVRQASENPSAYLALMGKVLPRDVTVEIERSAWEAIEETESVNGDSTQAQV